MKALKTTQPRATTSVWSMLRAAAAKKEQANASGNEAIELTEAQVVEEDPEGEINDRINCIE